MNSGYVVRCCRCGRLYRARSGDPRGVAREVDRKGWRRVGGTTDLACPRCAKKKKAG